MNKEQCTHAKVACMPMGGNANGWTPRWICYECGLEFEPVSKTTEFTIKKLERILENVTIVLIKAIRTMPEPEVFQKEIEHIFENRARFNAEIEKLCGDK